MAQVKIVLSKRNFQDLVSGKEVNLAPRDENSTKVEHISVSIILGDIGFVEMDRIVNNVANKRMSEFVDTKEGKKMLGEIFKQ